MKNSSLGIKILMAAVCLAVVAYFGIQIYRYVDDPLTTTPCYAYQVEDSLSANGYVVRNEQVLTDNTSGLLRLSRQEGEKVSKGGEIAVVYADQASLDRQTQIDSLSAQIGQLQYAQENSLGSEASLKLDTQITQSLLALRGDLSADRLDTAETETASLRSLVLKRDYTYSDTDDLQSRLTDLQAQLKALRAQSSSSAKRVTAPESGVYSAVVDGYESVLTPAFLDTLTPSSLAAVKPAGETSSLGKLILGDSWYYAAVMNAADAAQLSVGSRVSLRFAKGGDRDLAVTVISVSKEEEGRTAVAFRGRTYLSEVTQLREQSADVIESRYSGLRVPQSALRLDEKGQTGLYCVVGLEARFKPVKVLYNGDGFALVESTATTDRTRLRAGDQVIVTAKNVYDGMVVDDLR